MVDKVVEILAVHLRELCSGGCWSEGLNTRFQTFGMRLPDSSLRDGFLRIREEMVGITTDSISSRMEKYKQFSSKDEIR